MVQPYDRNALHWCTYMLLPVLQVPCDCTHVCHPSWPQIVMAQLIRIMDAQPPRQA